MPPKSKSKTKTKRSKSPSVPKQLTMAKRKEKLIDIIDSIHYLDENRALKLLNDLEKKEEIHYTPNNLASIQEAGEDYQSMKSQLPINTLVTDGGRRDIVYKENVSVLSQACLYGMYSVVAKVIELGGDVEQIAQDNLTLIIFGNDSELTSRYPICLRGANMLHVCSMLFTLNDSMVGISKQNDSPITYLFRSKTIDYSSCIEQILARTNLCSGTRGVEKLTNMVWMDPVMPGVANRITFETMIKLKALDAPTGYIVSKKGLEQDANKDQVVKRNTQRIIETLKVLCFNMSENYVRNGIGDDYDIDGIVAPTPLSVLLFSNPFQFSSILACVTDNAGKLYEKKKEEVNKILYQIVHYSGTIDGEPTHNNIQSFNRVNLSIMDFIDQAKNRDLTEYMEGGPPIGTAVEPQGNLFPFKDNSIHEFYESLMESIDIVARPKPAKSARKTQVKTRKKTPSPSPSRTSKLDTMKIMRDAMTGIKSQSPGRNLTLRKKKRLSGSKSPNTV